MGVKTAVAAVVPATTHTTAAQGLGRNPVMMNAQLAVQANDLINLMKQTVKDMTVGNPSDPNITTLNAQITALS